MSNTEQYRSRSNSGNTNNNYILYNKSKFALVHIRFWILKIMFDSETDSDTSDSDT